MVAKITRFGLAISLLIWSTAFCWASDKADPSLGVDLRLNNPVPETKTPIPDPVKSATAADATSQEMKAIEFPEKDPDEEAEVRIVIKGVPDQEAPPYRKQSKIGPDLRFLIEFFRFFASFVRDQTDNDRKDIVIDENEIRALFIHSVKKKYPYLDYMGLAFTLNHDQSAQLSGKSKDAYFGVRVKKNVAGVLDLQAWVLPLGGEYRKVSVYKPGETGMDHESATDYTPRENVGAGWRVNLGRDAAISGEAHLMPAVADPSDVKYLFELNGLLRVASIAHSPNTPVGEIGAEEFVFSPIARVSGTDSRDGTLGDSIEKVLRDHKDQFDQPEIFGGVFVGSIFK